MKTLNILCKWRAVYAGWQLGTRIKGDPECDAVRDHREATLIHRAEISALTALLLRKGVFTSEEFSAQIEDESAYLCDALEKRFPGFKAAETGMVIDPVVAVNTMKGWKA